MTRVILQETKGVYVDGYEAICSFGKNRIVLCCHKRYLEILGNHLFIESFDGISMTVTGKIEAVKWLNTSDFEFGTKVGNEDA